MIKPDPTLFRFRIDADPDQDSLRPVWRGRYGGPTGFFEFGVSIDLQRRICLFGKLRFHCELVGREMSRVLGDWREARPPEPGEGVGPYRQDPNGHWLVLRGLLPSGTEAFLVGLSAKTGHGELVLHRREYAVPMARILREAVGRCAFYSLEEELEGPAADAKRGPRRRWNPEDAASPSALPVDFAATLDRDQVTRPAVRHGLARPGTWLPNYDDAFDLL